MQSVTVRYLGLVRNTVGKPEEVLELTERSTVRDILSVLAERHGDGFKASVLTRNGDLRLAVRLILDGDDADGVAELDASLGDASKLTIVVLVNPVIGG